MDNLTRTVDEAILGKDYAALSDVFDAGWNSVGQGEKRSLAAHFIQVAVNDANGFLPDAFGHAGVEEAMLAALGHLPATVEDAADSKLRMMLFEHKIANTSDYSQAARILGGTRMESETGGTYYVAPIDKLDIFVKIAECFLMEDEIAEADNAVNKAGQVAPLVSAHASASNGGGGEKQDPEQHRRVMGLLLRYKSAYARVLDANRKFLQAASRYHELSQQYALCDEEELLRLLGFAVTCAILAPSGTQRQRVLQHLYQDARLRQLDALDEFSTHSTILAKMYRHQILRPAELTQFESGLAEHQKAVMGDGLTIMERGVVEHNMTAVSRLYRTIYVSELAAILGVTAQKAEKIAADMILDGTIAGSIDQVESLLQFEVPESGSESWDRAISSFCIQLNGVTDAIKASGK